MKPRRIRLTAAAVLCALAGASCVGNPETTRIEVPPDTSVETGESRPEAGIYAHGGVYRLTSATMVTGQCRIDTRGGIEELLALLDPFDPKSYSRDTTEVPLEAGQLAVIADFLGTVEIRTNEIGSALVIGAALDVSQSLPWTGRVRGGAVDTLVATALVENLEERAVDIRVKTPQAPAGVDQPTAQAAVSLSWTELPLVPTWVQQVDTGVGRCSVDGTATLARTGDPLPPPPAPTGVSAVLSVVPAPAAGSPLEAALDIVDTLTWRPPPSEEDRTITMALPDGRLAAQGVIVSAGGGWALYLRGESEGVDFRLRGWKIEPGHVSGSLLAGDGESVAIASVDLAG